jgi:PTS system fructose-specific IIC component
MAAEALKRVARMQGHDIEVETQGAEGPRDPLHAAAIADADVVILATDVHVEDERFAGKVVHRTPTAAAIRETEHVLREALHAAGLRAPHAGPTTTTTTVPAKRTLVAITACPTGIAHTFMAAEALKKAAADAGYEIHIETQGSVGAKTPLTAAQIEEATAVIIGADTAVNLDRFVGKRLLRTSVGDALKRARGVIDEAVALPAPAGGAPSTSASTSLSTATTQPTSAKGPGPYQHLLTGVSFMLPMVVAGGLILALSFAFSLDAAKEQGTLAAALSQIGGGAAFALMVPVLAGYIAFSIADRPGLTPGFVGGLLAMQLQAGFLGGIVAGFLAGYVARFLRDAIALPKNLEGLKPVLVLPLLSTLIVGLAMVYVVGAPVAFVMRAMTTFLQGLTGTNAVLLGALLGGMMAIDMGGPVNKAAYAFTVGLLSSNTYTPMAAVMAAGMTPPLGIALATFVARSRFTAQEREAGKAALVLGLAFITEGAIPFAARDPLRVVPCMTVGAASAGALSMLFGVALRAPHGGLFVLAIPGAVAPVWPFLLAVVVGSAVTGALVVLTRKRP